MLYLALIHSLNGVFKPRILTSVLSYSTEQMVWRNIIELARENDLKYKGHMYKDTDVTSDSQQLLEVRETDINK